MQKPGLQAVPARTILPSKEERSEQTGKTPRASDETCSATATSLPARGCRRGLRHRIASELRCSRCHPAAPCHLVHRREQRIVQRRFGCRSQNNSHRGSAEVESPRRRKRLWTFL